MNFHGLYGHYDYAISIRVVRRSEEAKTISKQIRARTTFHGKALEALQTYPTCVPLTALPEWMGQKSNQTVCSPLKWSKPKKL